VYHRARRLEPENTPGKTPPADNNPSRSGDDAGTAGDHGRRSSSASPRSAHTTAALAEAPPDAADTSIGAACPASPPILPDSGRSVAIAPASGGKSRDVGAVLVWPSRQTSLMREVLGRTHGDGGAVLPWEHQETGQPRDAGRRVDTSSLRGRPFGRCCAGGAQLPTAWRWRNGWHRQPSACRSLRQRSTGCRRRARSSRVDTIVRPLLRTSVWSARCRWSCLVPPGNGSGERAVPEEDELDRQVPGPGCSARMHWTPSSQKCR
jgi:hypothetical protein